MDPQTHTHSRAYGCGRAEFLYYLAVITNIPFKVLAITSKGSSSLLNNKITIKTKQNQNERMGFIASIVNATNSNDKTLHTYNIELSTDTDCSILDHCQVCLS